MSILARKGKLTIFWIFWLGLFYIIWSKMLVLEADGLYAGWVNIWGDWAAHLSYATSFGYGRNIPLEMPILAGAKFSYPFLADWFSGMLMKLNISLVSSMLVPSLVFSMFLVTVLIKLGEKMIGSLKGGIIVSWLFLFNGGLGFWWWIKDIKNVGLLETMTALPREYTHLEKLANIEWINIITSQVVPQRGFLMGFPLAVIVYYLLWREFENKNKTKKLWLAGGLTSLLPLIHAHSFVLVSWVAGWLMIMELFKQKNKWLQLIKFWSWFWLPVIFLGLPQIGFFYGGSLSQDGFIRWQPGWMAQGNWLWFWVKNLGFGLALMLIGLRKAPNKLVKFSLPFWCLFLIANLWIFQPWEWDNSKILTHWYLMASVFGAVAVINGFKQKNRWLQGLTGLILGLSLLSGGLDVIRLTQYKNIRLRFFDRDELQLAQWVRNNTNKDSRFLTADNHDHWVPCLTGRKIVMGFKGWLWTYGLNYSKQELAVKQAFEGGEMARQALAEYGVDYVVVGPLERYQRINEQFYENNFKLVYFLGETKIFEVTNLE